MKTEEHKIEAKKGDSPLSPIRYLREAFLERRERNSSYSLRAFARDVGMSQPLLSLVMNGKRPLTLKQAHKIAALLGMSTYQRSRFISSVVQSLPENAKVSQKIKRVKDRQEQIFEIKDQDIEKFRMIANWYHLPILDLTTTQGFRSNATWVAKRLGISKVEVEEAVERLSLLGLLKIENGKWTKTARNIDFPTRDSQAAVRSFHQQMLDQVKTQLGDASKAAFQSRSISGLTAAIDPSKMDEAKEFIEEFKAEFARRFTQGVPTEVYQLNVQLFPLTKFESKKE